MCYEYGAYGGVMNFCMDGKLLVHVLYYPCFTNVACPKKLVTETHAAICDGCHESARCEPGNPTNGTFACVCADGFMGDGQDCAEKLGTMTCYSCHGHYCDSPAKNQMVRRCPYEVYSCQMFVARESRFGNVYVETLLQRTP